MGWTSDQHKAIYTDTGDGNILVSAAAGSGKTAVLVERILQKIISGKSSIDRLLIVTFTEAAASEMREKIIRRMCTELDNTADTAKKKFIKSQIRLAETADIMTIDAFCSRVVKNNFHILGIDPDINIANSASAASMISDAFTNVCDRIYKSDDKERKAGFSRLTSFFAQDRSNKPLFDIITAIYKFTSSFAEPEKWVSEVAQMYKLPPQEWATEKYHEYQTKKAAQEFLDAMSDFQTEANPETVQMYDSLKEASERLLCADRDEMYRIYKEYFGAPKIRKKYRSDAEVDSDDRKYAVRRLCDIYESKGSRPPKGVTSSVGDLNSFYDCETLRREAEDLCSLFLDFLEEYKRIKEAKCVYEFSDIEHYTYRLFRDSEEIRNEYINKYDEILIDEYQDTNALQDAIFTLISKNNIFMVGDLKQSIYRFRKGDPYIFKAKSAEYAKSTSPHTLITLSQNFRSRKEVLNSVNDIFSAVMSDDAGDVNYTESQRIVREDEYEYYPAPDSDCKSELHYIAVDKDAANKDEYEAIFTARKIRELLDQGVKVYDKSQKAMRPIQKRDIVILESSLKYNCDFLSSALEAEGIDSYVDLGSFFDRREITVMMSLISVINNAHQDIPLISVMRSPIGGFTDNELAQIRINSDSREDFIDSVKNYIKNGENKYLKSRLKEFISNISRWRGYVRKKPVSQLIWSIYEETCFYDIMGALEEGEEAQTNLRLLYERAKQFESAGFKGIFNFIKYIEQLQNDPPKEMGSAKLIGESHDVVRIMTIHKSKGLEFPYVFMLGMGRNFINGEGPALVRMHKDCKIALPQICYEKHYARKTPAFETISRINGDESISERMRVLYVAMTRAEEKLYAIVCQNKRPDDTANDIMDGYRNSFTGKMCPEESLEAKGFYSWLCPASSVSDSWRVFTHTVTSAPDTGTEEKGENIDAISQSEDLKDSVDKILGFAYPYAECYTIPSRTSVTQLKEMSEISAEGESQEPYDFTDETDTVRHISVSQLNKSPRFIQEDSGLTAAEIGLVYHRIMANIDLDAIRKNPEIGTDTEIERLISENIITDMEMQYVDRNRIAQFYKSEMGMRVLNSDCVYREKPFQINIPASLYDPSLSDKCANETVILQGIIDCLFEEDGEFVLLDYKTDKVENNAAEIRKRYNKQLELYQYAIEELTRKPVKQSRLYLFDTGETV